ncbi:MAG: PQQ-binding-like beta-propeller repeat protein [Planctomycetota bacterium]
MMRVRCTVAFGLIAGVIPAVANDWPSWRGPEQTGMTREKAVVTSWSPQGENLLWKVPIEGRTTPIVMGGRLFAIAPVGEGIRTQERVLCLDAESGKTLWEHRFNVFDSDIVQQRLGWTALAGDPESGLLYAHGTGGEFFCFDRDGKIVWKRSLTEEFGRISGYGGRLHTPIVDENRVVISFMSSSWGDQAKPLHRYLAFDKRNGKVLWWAAPGEQPYDTTYAVPAIAVIDGKRMMIAPNGDGNVYGMLARTGEKLWTVKVSKRGLNSSVVVDGRYAYVTNGEENIDSTEMGAVLCIDASKTGDITTSGIVWRAEGIKAGFASPALANGRLYVVDNSANLLAFDAKTGKKYWEYGLGRVGKGSPTVTADGVIYVGEQNGLFHILKDDGDKCTSLDKEEFEGPDGAIDEIYGSPMVVDGRVYFMTRYNTYCLGKKGHKPEKVAIPPMAAEPDTLGAIKSLHLVPADVTVAPGESVKFTPIAFDENGRPIPLNEPASDASQAWAAAGIKGQIDHQGVLTIGPDNVFSAGIVTRKIGETAGTARVRVSPKVPFTEGFDAYAADAVPPGWLSVTAKTKVVEKDGSKVLMKLAEKPAPPFMRIRAYLTNSLPGGYTMQADMLGTPKGERFKPDMGLINTRYFVTMQGGEQTLQIESWSPMPRVRHEAPFAWQTDKWYTMKVRVEPKADQAIIRAKVWPRGETEPAAWSIEFTDPSPNREGSPGIYGYSPGTTAKSKGPEVYFDNIQVIPND